MMMTMMMMIVVVIKTYLEVANFAVLLNNNKIAMDSPWGTI